jgi:hypothetical protein
VSVSRDTIECAERAAKNSRMAATAWGEVDRLQLEGADPIVTLAEWNRLGELIELAKANAEVVAARLAGEAVPK